MTRIFTIGSVLVVALGTAHAQEAAPLSTFLEKRVPDELAVEGVMLSRRNLSLRIEQVGDQFLISLVDLRTGQVTASTKLASLPDDRDAAVAAVTHVVADLAREGAPAETRADAVQDQVDEQRYKQIALRIGERYELDGARDPSLVRRWVVYQGEQNHEVDPVSFYGMIGRGDLGDLYKQRIGYRNIALGIGGAAAIASILAVAVAAAEGPGVKDPSCDINLPQAQFAMCLNQTSQANDQALQNSWKPFVPALLFAIGAGISFGIAAHYRDAAQPVTEDEAMSLADAYNHRLRRHLGMQTAAIKRLQLAPFSTGASDGGLALGGAF